MIKVWDRDAFSSCIGHKTKRINVGGGILGGSVLMSMGYEDVGEKAE